MKTVLNEFVEYLQEHNFGCTQKTLEKFLKKEKQQIIDAGNSCAMKQHLLNSKIEKMTNDELLEFSNQKIDTVGVEYYNETFS